MSQRLTPQETYLLVLLIQGHHKKTAADVMGISVNTVSFHLKNVYAKLQVHSKTEAVVKVLMSTDPTGQLSPPDTSRYSHALANFQSRSTVARETPIV